MTQLQPDINLPHHDHQTIRYWVDERIWGHRIWDNQTPWLIFLEFAGIAESAHRDGSLLDERGSYYPLLFRPHQRILLRNVLYNNQILPFILDRFPDDGRAWREWTSWMQENARGVAKRDFDYLQDRFSGFREFARLISMLRTSTVESESNRRWSSRFLFPFGESCLYEDLNINAANKVSREYINFGRTGELLYLMLCRSSSATTIVPFLQKMVTNQNPWNTLVALLQDDEQEHREQRGKSYLPYTTHTAFDTLGADILHLFQLDLPGFDAYPHIALMSSMHVMLYQMAVSSQILGITCPPIVCEIVAPRKTLVRELSINSYQYNSQLSAQAVTAYIDSITSSDEWKAAESSSDAYPRCKTMLLDQVVWPRDADDYDKAHEPGTMIKHLRQSALSRHRQHAGNVHRSYGRSIGLISKRGTNKLRYAPNDALLKSLILANVSDRMEFKEFLQRLFMRYGIVIGEREADQSLEESEFDSKVFQSNASRLEQRLSSLGMLRRLSDACAYVLNPYAETAR
ncbi:MAG: hypothetical protein MPJ50_11900 [Pirellulales bacterium]|nr:hypothetical protein [Pirellulales bacterium]